MTIARVSSIRDWKIKQYIVGGTSKNEIVKFFPKCIFGGKGIEVEVGETECTLDLYIVAKMGYRITCISWRNPNKK